MSTHGRSPPLAQALSGVPPQFRGRLIAAYESVKRDYSQARYESCGLSGGKLCEITLRLLQHVLLGSFTPFGTKIANFVDECQKLTNSPAKKATDSLRVVLPRALIFVYTMRSKRGIGHVGGDVDANRIDSATIVRAADWTVCELVRVFHGLPIEEAQDLVDSLATRDAPDVWEVAGKRRVLRADLSKRDQCLLLLYHDPASYVLAEDLCSWVEYSSLSALKTNVLRRLHQQRLLELDEESDLVYLSPSGVREVESRILGMPSGKPRT